MARRMCAITPSGRPRKARMPMMTISRYFTDSSLPSPVESALSGFRAAANSGSSAASHSVQA
jgi:hypothetical protein